MELLEHGGLIDGTPETNKLLNPKYNTVSKGSGIPGRRTVSPPATLGNNRLPTPEVYIHQSKFNEVVGVLKPGKPPKSVLVRVKS